MESIVYQIDGAEETAVRYTEYQYDRRGQTTGYAELSQENEPTADEIKAHQIRYYYDSDGKLTKVTYPTTKNGVQALAYEYDQNGWLTKIKGEVQSGDGSTEKTVRSYTYDSYGKVKEIKDYRDLLNSSDQAVKKVYTYDSLDRVKEMTYTDLETGKVMESYQYSYDKNSNITEKTQVNNYPKEDADKVNETKVYTYDTLGRLIKTVTTDHKKDDKTKTVTYTYDNVGNRLKEDDGTTTTSYTYNGLDQLKTSTKEKGTAVEEVRQYDYDANGNQTDVKNTRTGEDQTYVYDAENRLSQVSVTKDGKTSVIQQNIYNGDGQRIQKMDGSDVTNYYYQDGVVAYTMDAAGEQSSQNLIGTEGNILATQRYQKDTTQYYLYNKDIQGSTTSLVKEDGSADATYQYTDFGETMIQGDDQAKNEVCYTGGIYDLSTGLYYLNARYYNPEDGRFMTEDSYRGEILKPETGHLYMYCANNPVNYVDPSGHWAIAIGVTAKAGCIIYIKTGVFFVYDSNGNSGIMLTMSGGVEIDAPDVARATEMIIYPGTNNIKKLNGYTADIGASIGFGIFSLGGSVNIDLQPQKMKNNSGGSISGGMSKPGLKFKVSAAATKSKLLINFKNLLKKNYTYTKKIKNHNVKIVSKKNKNITATISGRKIAVSKNKKIRMCRSK